MSGRCWDSGPPVGERRGTFLFLHPIPHYFWFPKQPFGQKKTFCFKAFCVSLVFSTVHATSFAAVQFLNPTGAWFVRLNYIWLWFGDCVVLLLGFVYEIRFAKESFWLIDPTCRGGHLFDSLVGKNLFYPSLQNLRDLWFDLLKRKIFVFSFQDFQNILDWFDFKM